MAAERGATTLTIQIYDTNLEPYGNDFALDDRSLTSPVPEPSTLAGACIAGLFGLAYAGRRRRA